MLWPPAASEHVTWKVQLGAGKGPRVETARTGLPLDIPDLTALRQRRPRFTEAAADRGFRASHTFPLSVRGASIGALNLFSDRVGTLKSTEATLVQAFAQVATIAVLQEQSLQQHAAVWTQLQRAWKAGY
jgi:GAF domain-containing protein